jgi:very-short-patch-repair endonuclease
VTVDPKSGLGLTSPCKGEVGGEAAGRGSNLRFTRTKTMTNRARRLRGTMTDAELKLWNALRRRQIDGLQFRRQHAVGSYVLDFHCPTLRLAIEIDGGQHNTASGQAADAARSRWLGTKGIAVQRYWNNDVLTNLSGVLEDLARLVEQRRREVVRDCSSDLTPPRHARSQVYAGCVNLPAMRADPPLSGEGEGNAA